MNNNRFYVYFLIDSQNSKPFYVGKGTGDRCNFHLREAAKQPESWSNNLKCRRINAIIESGYNIIIEKINTNLSEEDALTIEANYIREFGRLVDNSGYLTNIICDGSMHHTYKRVDQYDLNDNFIQTYDSVQEAASIAGVTANTMSGVINKRTSNGKTLRTAGGYRWVHHKANLQPYNRYDALYEKKKKKVCQYTMTGEYIKMFDSAKQANLELGLCVHRISSCCHKKRLKTVGGFCWAFESETPILPNLKHKRYA